MLFGFLGSYSVSGLPEIAAEDDLDAFNSPPAWRRLSASVEAIRQSVSQQAGVPAAVVGMDKYSISSELAFCHGLALPDGSPRVAGRGLFPNVFDKDQGMMWKIWAPREKLLGRPVVMVSFTENELGIHQLADHFDRLSPIRRHEVREGATVVTAFFWRAGYGYREPGP